MKFLHYIHSFPYALEAASRVMQEAISNYFKENNIYISHEEFVILDTIYCNPGILQIDLAKKVLKSRAHTGRFLNSLEEKGYIKREKGIKGKRQVIMRNYLSEDGQKLHQSIVKLIKKYINETMPSKFNDNDLEKFIDILNEIKTHVEVIRNVKFD